MTGDETTNELAKEARLLALDALELLEPPDTDEAGWLVLLSAAREKLRGAVTALNWAEFRILDKARPRPARRRRRT